MQLLGIDYGEKRVGVASTDESGEFALPRLVINNSPELINEIVGLINKWKIEKVILGESKKLDGRDNIISKDIEAFKNDLEERGVKVEMHPEFFTSVEAERIQGKGEMLDASAASLILKSYIDTVKNDYNRSI
jgi:putative Holliday junction resolvase